MNTTSQDHFHQDDHFKMPVAVHLVLVKEKDVLLLLRQNTGFADGCYSLVAGHVDGHETAMEAMIREANEEIGISINPSDLAFSSVMHRFAPNREGIDFFFFCSRWQNEIRNLEPNKCGGVQFFPINNLPEKTIPYIRRGISLAISGVPYCEMGWDQREFISRNDLQRTHNSASSILNKQP